MAEDVVNSHKDVSQTTTKIDWLSGPLSRLAISGEAVSKTMNLSTWFVLRVHLSTTNTEVKKEATNQRRFCSKGDFASI